MGVFAASERGTHRPIALRLLNDLFGLFRDGMLRVALPGDVDALGRGLPLRPRPRLERARHAAAAGWKLW